MLQREYFKFKKKEKKKSQSCQKETLLWMLILFERKHQCFRRLSLGAKFDTVVTADLFLGERLRKICCQTAGSALKSSASLSSIIFRRSAC